MVNTCTHTALNIECLTSSLYTTTLKDQTALNLACNLLHALCCYNLFTYGLGRFYTYHIQKQ